MRKQAFLSFIVSLLLAGTALSQTPSKVGRVHNVYFEAAGLGGLYSLNYDTRFQNSPAGLGARVGLSYFSLDGETLFTLPVMLNYLLGKHGNYFEVGIGTTLAYYHNEEIEGSCGCVKTESLFDPEGTQFVGTMVIGYRWQPTDRGFMFRIGISPVFNREEFIPYYPYLSLGYSF